VHRELILLPSLAASRGPTGRLVLTHKYLDGAAEFAAHWPGPVTTLVHERSGATTDLDPTEVEPGQGVTGLELRPTDPAALRERLGTAACVLAFLSRTEAPLVDLCVAMGLPVVFISEYSPATERQILAAEVANPMIRLRRLLWLWRTERIRRRILQRASGLQCSGTPAHETYRDRSPDPLLFFDNRVRRAELIDADGMARKAQALAAGAPLRLVFGGRLVAMKGVLDLPAVARALVEMGVPFTFDIFGAGPLEPALAAAIRDSGLSDRMHLRGTRDFRTGWLPHLRDQADLFVCCHPQGDPSSTYPEVMSCGVPIVGYANEALQGIVALSGGGRSVPMRDVAALARAIADLHRDRDAIVTASARGRDFAAQHVFEATYAARTAHLIRNSRLPEDLRRRTQAG
jgi:glycosyltransferase involved in cell wall biosynthesis